MSLSVIILNHDPNFHYDSQVLIDMADEIIILHDSEKGKFLSKLTHPKIKLLQHPLEGDFSAQRNFGLTQAKGDWVLFIDSDEVVTQELSKEISNAITNQSVNGFFLKRHDYFYGLPLSHGEPGAVRLLRLARHNTGKFSRPVHETWEIAGPTGDLLSPLKHLRANLTTGFIDRMTVYSPLDAETLTKEHKPFSLFRLFVYPKAKFIQNYIMRLGFLDGLLGLFHAYLMSVQSLTVRVYQWELENRK